ncbi:MAG TPA: aminoglycoside adenylyltransferase domain-containing protein [Candidatus Baltobacteraceae bacterium]|nr:aminoglycoside adenylyltransferase domain-containing protein [Candidatus Baltobacteraceae bacterium]
MSRGRSVADADRDVRQYLVRIAAVLGEVLGEKLAGLYVHGSLATGAFHRERSDIDLIAVTRGKLTPALREALALALVQLSDARPVPGDIEVSVIQERYARAFEHPMPYEVHYSSAWHEKIRRRQVDFTEDRTNVDLAANIVDARERGVTLYGPPPGEMFGPVPWHAYIGALEADFRWARGHVRDMPMYAVLGACRVLHGATARAVTALNKDEAGVWAVQNVPRMYHSVINDALQLYRGTKSLDDVVLVERDIIAFREFVRERSQPAFARASDTDEEDA